MNLGDHMRKLWAEVGFQPTSFTLPSGDDSNDQNDIPIADSNRFNRVEKPQPVTEELEERFVGMTIANISLDVSDEDVKKFVAEYVSENIDDTEIGLVRDNKKITVTITSQLNSKVIKETMSKINFSDCREKFFGRPLYCRPLRDITPE